MKAQTQPFIIKLNLQFFVISLLIFTCGIAIGAAFFSSFPENLMILTLKLHSNSSNPVPFPVPFPVPTTTNNVQRFSNPDNAQDNNNYSQTEKPVSSYTRLDPAAMVSRTRDEPTLERAPDNPIIVSLMQASFVNDKPMLDSVQTEAPIRGDFVHEMDDNELMIKASTVSRDRVGDQSRIVPKVAFMFLVKGPMHLLPLWERFFKGNQDFFSIYVHSSPLYIDPFSQDSVFHGRRIPSQEVRWGKFNMVEAERRLIANALLDESNQRFVLLSESCTPLFNFSTIYSYLINSNETFVEAYDLPGPVGRDRYSRRMQPVVSISQWRKGSQWFQIDRALALEVVLDNKYFWVFKRFCRGSCYGDEHYLPTFVNIEFGERNSNRTLTWVDWSRGGPHPGRFERPLVTVEFLERLRNNRGCKYNGSGGNICFLFARKFPPSSVIRLLLFAAKVLNIP